MTTFGSIVWHFSGLVEIHKMERVNKRAIRFHVWRPINCILSNFKRKNEKTLYGKRIRSICCEIFKRRHDLNPKYMADIFEQRPSPYPSRRPYDILVPGYVSKTFGKNSLRVDGASLWNSLPENFKSASCLAVFKKGIMKSCYLLANAIKIAEILPLTLGFPFSYNLSYLWLLFMSAGFGERLVCFLFSINCFLLGSCI